jgi:ABC-type transport system involved in multi-copper enzyme maturation permease subunit
MTFGQATRVYARLALLRGRRRRLPWLMVGAALLPLLLTVPLTLAGHWGRGLFDDIMEVLFRFLVPFAPALLLAGHLADEIDRKTVSFLFARPAPRGALCLGKWLVVAVPLTLEMPISIGITFALSMVKYPGDVPDNLLHLLRMLAAAAVGVPTFASIAQLVGARFRKHPVVAVLTALVLDSGLASLPVALHVLSPTWHLRNLAELPLPSTYFQSAAVRPWVSMATLVVMGGAATWLTLVLVERGEFAVES